MFKKILIANRGEIACRVIKTCRRMGIRTVAIYSDIDKTSLHTKLADEAWHVGASPAKESYLNIHKIIEIAKLSHAEAIHPGYGFLSENVQFAEAVEQAGLSFIGPSAESINAMGSKSNAKLLMEKAGVPVVPGYHGDNQDQQFLLDQANQIGYPLLIKAVAGGGGKGMRLVNHADEFLNQLETAKREAINSFGDDIVLLEKFIENPHHIEFQVFGDMHGNFFHLYERECSIQRRHQKILEETPSPFLNEKMRSEMGNAAVAATKAINYRGAGTIEFIAGKNRKFYFMEMNTRLQVEHPITEAITGLDLVEWQLRVAAGEKMPLSQSDIRQQGHAIEVRICAENPDNDFLPETGIITQFLQPTNHYIRIDTGIESGDKISIYYDSMIAKLIVYGKDRSTAIRYLQTALDNTAVVGVTNNIALLQKIVYHSAFVAGNTDTHFIEAHRGGLFKRSSTILDICLIAATCFHIEDSLKETDDNNVSPWNLLHGWRLNATLEQILRFYAPSSDSTHIVRFSKNGNALQIKIDEKLIGCIDFKVTTNQLRITYQDKQTALTVLHNNSQFVILLHGCRYELYLKDLFEFDTTSDVPEGRLTAMMPGCITKIFVQEGDKVNKGQTLLTMEAMKMEHTIKSPYEGMIEKVFYKTNEIIEADVTLFSFKENH